MIRRSHFTLAAVALLAACSSGADPAEVVDTVRLTEQSQLQAIESGDLTGVVRLYADDAVLVRPDGSRIEGGAAIGEEYAALLEDPKFALTIEPVTGWAAASDDLAVLTSLVDFTRSDPATGEPRMLAMRSMTVWRKAPGGSWMIVAGYNVPRAAEAQPSQ